MFFRCTCDFAPRFSHSGIKAQLFVRKISFELHVLCFGEAFGVKIIDTKARKGSNYCCPCYPRRWQRYHLCAVGWLPTIDNLWGSAARWRCLQSLVACGGQQPVSRDTVGAVVLVGVVLAGRIACKGDRACKGARPARQHYLQRWRCPRGRPPIRAEPLASRGDAHAPSYRGSSPARW